MYDLTGFQRDLLYVTAGLEEPHGLAIKDELEEFGWRGFLQPRLQEQRSALFAAVVIGIIWALWHAPLTIGGTGAGYESGEIIGLLIGLPFGIVLYYGRKYLVATRPEPPIPGKTHSHCDS